jgi:hypothetical protein
MTARGTILLVLAMTLTPMASAQKLRSAEDGSVPLTFDSFTLQGSTISIKPGDAAWSEGVRPAMAVRLVDATVKRPRPAVEGVPAGTLLFGYRLSTGYAYCPSLNVEKPWKDVQCYRDLDGDGTFDGGYVTGERDAKNPYFSAFLKGLTSVPKYKYESASGALFPPATASFVFVDMKQGAPRFRVHVGKDPLKNLFECRLQSDGVCDVLGVRLAFATTDQGALSISLQGAAPERTFDLVNVSNPLKP